MDASRCNRTTIENIVQIRHRRQFGNCESRHCESRPVATGAHGVFFEPLSDVIEPCALAGFSRTPKGGESIPQRTLPRSRCGRCSAHSRGPLPALFGGTFKMRPALAGAELCACQRA